MRWEVLNEQEKAAMFHDSGLEFTPVTPNTPECTTAGRSDAAVILKSVEFQTTPVESR